MKKKLLVISNGKGEDSIAVTILNKLRQVLTEENIAKDDITISTLPLVDNGAIYKKHGFDTIATWSTMPSKGFNILNIFNLIKDIKYGLFQNLRYQIKMLKKESLDADLLVSIGDIFPLFLAGVFGNNKPIIHIGTAISAYIRDYSLLEIFIMKKYTVSVICRDRITALKLKKHNVPAIFYGNPMMDDPILDYVDIDLGIEKKKKNIVLVPSSRDDAYYNTQRMLSVIKQMGAQPQLQFILSLAPNLNIKLMQKSVNKKGWKLITSINNNQPKIAEIINPEASPVYVIKGYFRNCLDEGTMVFGMTGTGNEQIAGLGIPIILFKGRNAAASSGRMHHYKKLLGEAVFVTRGNDKKIAQDILSLLKNPRRLNQMAQAGKERMGKTGGAYSIARKLYIHLMNPGFQIRHE